MATKTNKNSEKSSPRDTVYVAVNKAMPGYCKVGSTSNIAQRIKDLSKTTSIPLPFTCCYARQVKDESFAKDVEKKILYAFDAVRASSRREFLEIEEEKLVALLELFEGKDVTPGEDTGLDDEDIKDLHGQGKREESRRADFRFEMVDLKKGAELEFIGDKKIKVTVVDDRRVAFPGEDPMFLSGAAQKAGVTSTTAQGPVYWIYKDPKFGKETLDTRRRRMEGERDGT